MYVCTYVHVYLCACACVCVRVCRYVCIYVCMHVCMCVCMYVCICMCVCVCVYIYIYIYIYICMCLHVHVCVCVCVCLMPVIHLNKTSGSNYRATHCLFQKNLPRNSSVFERMGLYIFAVTPNIRLPRHVGTDQRVIIVVIRNANSSRV